VRKIHYFRSLILSEHVELCARVQTHVCAYTSM